MKVIVFDLDETLGYFSQFSLFWNALMRELKLKNLPANQELFNGIFSLYPEFVRPNIFRIFQYIKRQKENGNCGQVLVYTNNTGPHVWVRMLLKYFNEQFDGGLIDRIIHAFVPDEQGINSCRTSVCKSYNDLIRCTSLPRDTEICFVDDMYYPTMITREVYYINIKPYCYNLPFDEILRRFKTYRHQNNHFGLDDESLGRIQRTLNGSTFMCFLKSSKEQKLDRVIGKMLLENIRTFLRGPSVYKIVPRYTQRIHPMSRETTQRNHGRMYCKILSNDA